MNPVLLVLLVSASPMISLVLLELWDRLLSAIDAGVIALLDRLDRLPVDWRVAQDDWLAEWLSEP